jgi:hypothetical protein
MSGKRKKAPPIVNVKVKNRDGTFTTMSQASYNSTQALLGEIGSANISSLDRKEFGDDINARTEAYSDDRTLDFMNGLENTDPGKATPDGTFNQDGLGPKRPPVDYNALKDDVKIRQEMADAIAGTKPKYRYRKYLDQVSMLQQDQPGQLQTVLARTLKNGGSILGGGMM